MLFYCPQKKSESSHWVSEAWFYVAVSFSLRQVCWKPQQKTFWEWELGGVLRFSQRFWWKFWTCRIWRPVVWYGVTNLVLTDDGGIKFLRNFACILGQLASYARRWNVDQIKRGSSCSSFRNTNSICWYVLSVRDPLCHNCISAMKQVLEIVVICSSM
jgi:hypothetical protein